MLELFLGDRLVMVVFLGLAAGTPLWGILRTAVLKANASMCSEIIVVL